MKVKELISKAHLYGDQKVKIRDHSTAATFITQDRYTFALDSDEVERIHQLKVNTFEITELGLLINAE